jgi:hypothetical protein
MRENCITAVGETNSSIAGSKHCSISVAILGVLVPCILVRRIAGYVAIGSEKGEIRFFNKINMKAKTLLPGLGGVCAGAPGELYGFPWAGVDTWPLLQTRSWVLTFLKTANGSWPRASAT